MQRPPAVESSTYTTEVGRDARAATLIIPVVALLVVLSQHAFLVERLADEPDGYPVLFNYGYGMLLFSLALTVIYWAQVSSTVAKVFRRQPMLVIFFAANVAVISAVLVIAFTKLGAITVMAIGAVSIFLTAITSHETNVATWGKILRGSSLSFLVLWITWGGAEVFLRFHPHLVGGGGGGNPALSEIYKDRYTTNAQGLRIHERFGQLEPLDNSTRILVVGDSFTFGQGVADDETFPFYLERAANLSSKTPHTVLNGGRSGTNTSDHLRFVESRGLGLEPDAILVQFYLNDLEYDADAESTSDQLIDRLLNEPLSLSYSLFFLKDRFDRAKLHRAATARELSPAETWMEGLIAEIRSGGNGWQAFVDAVGGFAEFQSSQSIPVTFVLYPHPGIKSDTMREIHRQVAELATQYDLQVVDLIDEFEDLNVSDQIVSSIDHHPSSMMHENAANAVWRLIADERLVSRRVSHRVDAVPDYRSNP